MNTKLWSTTLVAILLATCHQDSYGMKKMPEPPVLHKRVVATHEHWSAYQAPASAARFAKWNFGKWSLTPIHESALGYTPDVMVIGCYDGYTSHRVVFAANTPKDSQGCVFQLSVQPLAETRSVLSDRDTNGGIKKGEYMPLSFKAQYAYAKYVPQSAWWGKKEHHYTLKGSATISSRIYGADGSFIAHAPVTTNQLSIHSNGSLSTLSSDVLHIKVPGKDGKPVYFIGGSDNISRAVYYEVSYGNDWNMSYNGVAGKCSHTGKIPQEAPRRGLVLILNEEDLECFERNMERFQGNIMITLRRLPLIMKHPELKNLFGF